MRITPRAFACVFCAFFARVHRASAVRCGGTTKFGYTAQIAAVSSSGAGILEYCAYLSIGTCSKPAITTAATQVSGVSNSNTVIFFGDGAARQFGSPIQWINGGSLTSIYTGLRGTMYGVAQASNTNPVTSPDMTQFVWKLAYNYPGTFFTSSNSYEIMGGGSSSQTSTGYYWDGPLLGGTGKILPMPGGVMPTAVSGPSSGSTNKLVLCVDYVGNPYISAGSVPSVSQARLDVTMSNQAMASHTDVTTN